jgi:hypothetical protein
MRCQREIDEDDAGWAETVKTYKFEENPLQNGKKRVSYSGIFQNANEAGRFRFQTHREPEVGAIPDGRSEQGSPAERLR